MLLSLATSSAWDESARFQREGGYDGDTGGYEIERQLRAMVKRELAIQV